MKQVTSIAALSLLAFALTRAASSSAEEILAKAREALGGAKLAAIQSLIITGDLNHAVYNVGESGETKSQPDVMKSDFELSILLPDKLLRSESMTLPNGMTGPTILECLNGDDTWNDVQSQPGMVVRIAGSDRPETDRKKDLTITFARYLLALLLTDRPAFPLTFTYVGETEAPDGHADTIDAKGPGNFAARLYINQKTHLPMMITYRGAAAARRRTMMMRSSSGRGNPDDLQKTLAAQEPREVDYQLRLSDYRKVNGVQLPHVLSWASGGATTEELEVKKYTVNGKLDASRFRK